MGDRQRLYGLNALVLTAGSGIGEAVARTLIKHGASVIAADTSNSGVERHFDNPFNIPVGLHEPGDVHAKPAGDRGSDLVALELFALYLTRFDDVLSQRAKMRLAS